MAVHRKGETIAAALKSGTVLIAKWAILPTDLKVESEPYVGGWQRVLNLDGKGLDRMTSRAGWTLFFIAGVIEKIAFGSDNQKAASKALRQIIGGLQHRSFNCLEIEEVTSKRFLGLPYVKVSVHLRHIQRGLVLFAEQV